MAIRVNPKLIDELEAYGAEDVSKCYHCGNCSAVCPRSDDPYVFPRRSMRNLQMGLEDKLKGTLEPWLCYYCGECSEQCPRKAEPGETMMSLRRWLTSRYDWTGISRLFYRSWRWEIGGGPARRRSSPALGFLLLRLLASGSIAPLRRRPTPSCPASTIHIFDWSLAMLLLACCSAMPRACGGSRSGARPVRSRSRSRATSRRPTCCPPTSSPRCATPKCEQQAPLAHAPGR